jgi:2-methylisocitrate lyase-like PEP mutase family enzyme
VDQALRRAHSYAQAGAECVFPILLWETDALKSFIADAPGPSQCPPDPNDLFARQARGLGVARISYAGRLHHDVMEHFGRLLQALPGAQADE